MKVAIWRTGHEIADTVADTIYSGFCKSDCNAFPPLDTRYHLDQLDKFDCHIGYGILRGMADVFRACNKSGKPWFCVDRGYWKPGHYDGYYRISLRGTQQTVGLDKLEPDYERWDRLGIDVLDHDSGDRPAWIHCPPTKPVEQFFNIKPKELPNDPRLRIRDKNTTRPLQSDLDNCAMLTTFNSSVGWEALRQGIPVISDPMHSIVGAYQKLVDKPIHADLEERRRLFALMASLQLSLEEIRNGQLWPLLIRLISI